MSTQHNGRVTLSPEKLIAQRRELSAAHRQLEAYRMENAHRWGQEHDKYDWWRRYQVGNDLTDGQSGPMKLSHFTVAPDDPGRLYYMVEGGEDRDCGSGRFAKLSDTRLPQGPWMSDTRAEILEHKPLITRLRSFEVLQAHPSVLITGLGLGMAVKAALAHGASRVDVVELDANVVVMCGEQFAHDPRVSIQVGDAFAASFSKGTRWDLAWHDIWPTINDENLAGMKQLRARYKSRASWQGCWQEAGCREMARLLKLAAQYQEIVGPL